MVNQRSVDVAVRPTSVKFQFDNSKTIRMVQYYKNCHFSIIENVSGGGLEGFQVHLVSSH